MNLQAKLFVQNWILQNEHLLESYDNSSKSVESHSSHNSYDSQDYVTPSNVQSVQDYVDKSTLFCNSNEFTGKTVCADVIDPVKSEYNFEDLRLAEMDVSVGILLCVIG
jgi:hypothetical protein